MNTKIFCEYEECRFSINNTCELHHIKISKLGGCLDAEESQYTGEFWHILSALKKISTKGDPEKILNTREMQRILIKYQ